MPLQCHHQEKKIPTTGGGAGASLSKHQLANTDVLITLIIFQSPLVLFY